LGTCERADARRSSSAQMLAVSGFESDPWVLWAIRAAIWMVLAFVAILGFRMIWGMWDGKLDVADLVTGPSGRLSNAALCYFVGVGVASMAVLRDAADGTLSWEVLAVYLVALGIFDVGKRGLNALEIIKGNGNGNHGKGAAGPPAASGGG
jgi:hypothetical protein